MNKAIILDRDGTINVDYGYVYEKDKLEFEDGVIDALHRLQDAGYLLLIVTNQSGVGRGYYTIEQYEQFQNYLEDTLQTSGVHIDGTYVCPHVEEDHCNCRKPQTTMYYQAAEDYDIDWSRSYVIGDKKRDLTICQQEPATAIWYKGEASPDSDICCMDDWNTIADYILKDNL